MNAPEILYEDNHVLAVNKPAGMLVQGDKTRDTCVLDAMKNFIKERDSKTGAVFMGLPHRLDRPTSGALVLAKTSKSLSRLTAAFRNGETTKLYWAVVEAPPDPPEGECADWLRKDGQTNTSLRVSPSAPGGREARLRYRLIGASERYTLIGVELLTGRHHQIRAQLSAMGCPHQRRSEVRRPAFESRRRHPSPCPAPGSAPSRTGRAGGGGGPPSRRTDLG